MSVHDQLLERLRAIRQANHKPPPPEEEEAVIRLLQKGVRFLRETHPEFFDADGHYIYIGDAKPDEESKNLG